MREASEMSRARPAAAAALVAAGLALAVAYASQQLGGLVPCELCLWQRWPYWLALGAGAVALAVPRLALPLVALAVVLLAGNAALGAYHAGVEWGFWPNILARCTPPPGPAARSVDDLMRALAAAPVVRCDEPAIRLLGLSMAGWNALYAAAAATICVVLLRRPGTPA
jgi:disulfide bond formation protein DsbB